MGPVWPISVRQTSNNYAVKDGMEAAVSSDWCCMNVSLRNRCSRLVFRSSTKVKVCRPLQPETALVTKTSDALARHSAESLHRVVNLAIFPVQDVDGQEEDV